MDCTKKIVIITGAMIDLFWHRTSSARRATVFATIVVIALAAGRASGASAWQQSGDAAQPPVFGAAVSLTTISVGVLDDAER